MHRIASSLELLEPRALLSASSLDNTFDGDGIVTLGTAAEEYAVDVIVQSDGKILAVGASIAGTRNGVLLRFLPNGEPDPLFGGGTGRVDVALTADVEFDAAAVDGSGNIYVVGTDTSSAGGANLVVARFTSAGVLDTTFAGGVGWLTIDLGGHDVGRDIVLSGGGIVVAGSTTVIGGQYDFAVVKLTTSGALDTSFNTSGIQIQDLNSGSVDIPQGIAVQSDGSIVLVGESDEDFAVLKLSHTGAFVASSITPVPVGAGALTGVTIGPGDSIIASGWFSAFSDHFVVAKYHSSTVLDTSFAGDGISEVAAGLAIDVTLDLGGNIVAVGISDAFEFAVARLNPVTGAPDLSFAPGGLVTTSVGGVFDAAGSVAVDSFGRLVVAGLTSNGSDLDFALARYGDAPSGVTVAQVDNDLVITGTATAEAVVITRNTAGIKVDVNGSLAGSGFNLPSGGRIIVRLGDGNDQLNVASSVTTRLFVDGGAGDDTIKGGNGHDILLGGPGDDRLMGSGGRDLMIGGDGADRMLGDNEDDILIAAYTAHDSNDTALFAIHTEWTSSRSYAVRVNNIRNGSGSLVRSNGSFFFDSATVDDDGIIDTLSGNAGTDWFVFNEGHDVITDLHRNEFGDDID